MALRKWEPLREIDDLFDRYVSTLGWPSSQSKSLAPAGDWAPRVDISETDQEFVVDAELPKVNKDEVKVSVENGVLTIQGERKQEEEEKGKNFTVLNVTTAVLCEVLPYRITWMKRKLRPSSTTAC